jgi:transposase-like protein
MGAITAEVVGDEAKRDTRGRKIIAAARWRELVAQYEGSGLTQSKFARREGINYSTFVAWLGRCRRTRVMARTPSPRFIEAQLPAGNATARRLEVVLPNGVVVRGEEIATLVALIKALGA